MSGMLHAETEIEGRGISREHLVEILFFPLTLRLIMVILFL